MRGEDVGFREGQANWQETPPRAWGIQDFAHTREFGLGNIPTNVGQAVWNVQRPFMLQKHPHVRGEDLDLYST